jgi:hypothetical protein
MPEVIIYDTRRCRKHISYLADANPEPQVTPSARVGLALYELLRFRQAASEQFLCERDRNAGKSEPRP